MNWLIALLFISSWSFAQTDDDYRLEDYVSRFQFKALTLPQKNKNLYNLGLKVFYDISLSGKGNIACFSCHSLPGFSGDTLPLGVGEGASGVAKKRVQDKGLLLPRHSPAIYNAGFPDVYTMFWDGRVMSHPGGGWQTPEPKLNGPNPELKEIAQTLASPAAVQALFPFASPEEMLGKESKLTAPEAWEMIMQKILSNPKYVEMLKAAFPEAQKFNIGHIGNAIAEVERHHFSATETPWDQYLRGNKNALTARMKRGAVLYMSKAQCFMCHNGPHLSSFGFQNIGIPQIGPGTANGDDKGRFDVTKRPMDMYKFRVSPLRNVGLTGPYMHSGVFSTLWEVIDHYDDPITSLRSFRWNSKDTRYRDSLNLDTNAVNLDNREKNLSMMLPRKLDLTTDEKQDLYCFLKVALTDVSLHKKLKGVENEVTDCNPVTPN